MKPLNQAAIAVAVATLATVAGAQESHKVLQYLNLLDRDAIAREAHATSPMDSMAQYGLDNTQQAALLSGDTTSIAKLAQLADDAFISIQITNIDETY